MIPRDIDAVEIWQNEKAPRDAEVAFWDRLLMAGRHVTAVGVSDWHRPGSRIDMAAVRVLADSLTQTAILDGIRRGHVIVMRDAATEPPTVRVTLRVAVGRRRRYADLRRERHADDARSMRRSCTTATSPSSGTRRA